MKNSIENKTNTSVKLKIKLGFVAAGIAIVCAAGFLVSGKGGLFSKNIPEPLVGVSSLAAIPRLHNIELTWISSSDIDLDKVVLERTSAGKKYTELKENIKVDVIDGKVEFKVIDNEPIDGANTYRIKSNNAAGELVYTPSKTVIWDANAY